MSFRCFFFLQYRELLIGEDEFRLGREATTAQPGRRHGRRAAGGCGVTLTRPAACAVNRRASPHRYSTYCTVPRGLSITVGPIRSVAVLEQSSQLPTRCGARRHRDAASSDLHNINTYSYLRVLRTRTESRADGCVPARPPFCLGRPSCQAHPTKYCT